MAFMSLFLQDGIFLISWFAISPFLFSWSCGLGIRFGVEIGGGVFLSKRWMCGVERILLMRRSWSMRFVNLGIWLRRFGSGLFSGVEKQELYDLYEIE